MATTARQPKAPRKGGQDSAGRRPPAWGSPRAPTFSPGNTPARLPSAPPPPPNQGAFPPLSGQSNGAHNPQDRILHALSGLTRYEGVIASTSGEGDTTGVSLKDVKELTKPGAPLKDSLFVASTNIDTWQSGPADAKVPNGDSFRTDTDISAKTKAGRERELQAWQPGDDTPGSPPATTAQYEGLDETTFGAGAGANSSWNQFDVNEKLFGLKTDFDENLYTTKLDRTAADYKERERKALLIANQIISGTTNNSHIAEERNMNVDDSGVNEEDKYGAVVRGTNAYVPPGARKHGQQSSVGSSGASGASASKPDIPKVSINAPDGAVLAQKETPPPSVKSPSPAPSSSSSNKPPADPLPAFRDFVTNEKQRLTQKKQALVKSEMDKRKAELLKFSQTFKLNKPIPDDLVPILAKDEDKQRQIRERATKDASSSQARSIGITTLTPSPSASRMPQVVASPSVKVIPDASRKAAQAPNVVPKAPTPAPQAVKAPAPKPSEASSKTSSGKTTISMFIQPIPPFKGSKSRSSVTSGTSTAQANGTSGGTPPVPTSPTTAAANRLNANASSFRPTPKASAPTPGPTSPIPSSTSASASPKPKPADTTPAVPNPFFGTKAIKRGPVHVKDDFNPFKHNKVVEASAVAAMWPYNGKRYSNMFPPLQHQAQQQPTHMPPPGPPPMQHNPYEETGDPRYVYAYAPYYPGQPMMPGMAPPPPGAYVSGPFMQPMPYPPAMPPHTNGQAMYAPSPMPQMPYMQPPPPGSYPAPPNGAGPRPSMPPTPIPAHAHPYYHQSPQMQHAVPYPMMMPPPGGPNGPPHPYDNSVPPVQMGGVGHV
ncbi:hypothetical protein SERLA73DRAFT_160712 [Serpula lacrymans var. lacrymans S7.3]|uniref:LsmAD domain-containing protein n=1 Tax=Serpula lacrymans var. lacrymans (strain S7.3) TaxID=936435 RepID=F8PWR8_SERL3|nr:hypothetical protein SERLA73DRAFT_160712 [Serpula lacrymans var. lacrymans S7.3]